MATHVAQLPAAHCLVCHLALGIPSPPRGQPTQVYAPWLGLWAGQPPRDPGSGSFLDEPSWLLLHGLFGTLELELPVYAQTLISAISLPSQGSVTINGKQAIKM